MKLQKEAHLGEADVCPSLSQSSGLKPTLSLLPELSRMVLIGHASHRPDLLTAFLSDSHPQIQGDLAQPTPQFTLAQESPAPAPRLVPVSSGGCTALGRSALVIWWPEKG